MRKKLILTAVLMAGMISSTYAADLEKVTVLNNGNLSISTTTDFTLPNWEVKWDVKVLKDYMVSFAFKDPQNAKKVSLNLTYDLEKNKSYSLLGIDGAEANMNFDLKDEIQTEIVNPEVDSKKLSIEKIVITDSKTVEVYYNQEVKAEEFTYRLLSELPTKTQKSDGEFLNIELQKPLEDLSSYLVLANSLFDAAGKEVKLKDIYYEFETPNKLDNVFEKLPELNAGWDENSVTSTGNIDEVAQKNPHNPKTWSEMWLALLLALVFAWIIYTRKKA